MPFAFISNPSPSSKYRPEIDGLRAIAILPVVFYHAGLSLFSGGFVGVDIFFVISGYLITSLIAKDIASNRFSIIEFYNRRIRRIFPALITVIIFCVVTAAALYPPQDFTEFGKSLVALTFFVSNIFFRRSASPDGYFDVAAEVQPLLHTWTLSVEEQFYIFFPLGLLLVTRCMRAKNRVLGCLLSAILASFALSVYAVEYRPLGAFYLLPPRAWELLMGSFLALRGLPPITHRVLREATSLLGLGLIGFAVFFYQKETPFPGLAALPPCLGACLVIYATETGTCLTQKLLCQTPIVFIGLISYSLYLWHWPLIVFTKYFFIGHLSDLQTAIVVFVSFLMAVLSFKFIETPFRKRTLTQEKWKVILWGMSASCFCLVLGLAVATTQGFPQRFDQHTLDIIAANTERKNDHGALQTCTHWRKDILHTTDLTLCPIGPADPSAKKILFWGDSHVEQLQLPIYDLHSAGELGNRTVIFALAAGCPPLEHMNLNSRSFYCDDFFRVAMQRAQEDDVDTVFMGFSTSWAFEDGKLCEADSSRCTRPLSQQEAQTAFLNELSQHIHALKGKGKKVILSLPFPIYDLSIPNIEIHNAMMSRYGSHVVPTEVDLPYFRDKLRDIARAAGATLFDPRQTLCVSGQCLYQSNGISLYSDNGHIAASQAQIFDSTLAKAFY